MTRTTTRADRTLSWDAVGESGEDVLVLVPGLGGGAKLFGTLPRRFARAGFRCLTFDPIGIPPSSRHTGAFEFDAAADDLLAVLDAAGAERAHIVGTSLGGKVALVATARHPDRVRTLTMLASSALVAERARWVYRFFERAAAELSPDSFADAVAAFLFGRTLHANRPALVADIARATRPSPEVRELMVAQARALQQFDGTEHARSVTTRTLCIAGAEDTLTEAGEVARTAEVFPDARYLEIADAGHSLLLESGEVFDAIVAFVRGDVAD